MNKTAPARAPQRGRHRRTSPAVLSLREMLRGSFDDSGRERSPEEQQRGHGRDLKHHPGLRLSDLPAYREVGSASRYKRKPRIEFPRMMADIESGAFGADGLLMWENSRTSRDAEEWIGLLRLMEKHGKVVCVWNQGAMNVYDPANHHDWYTLMREAIDAEKESRLISQRVRRGTMADAEAGKLGTGVRAFGYTKDGMHKDKREAAFVREGVRRVLAGESVRSIAADFNRRGIRTSAGNLWNPGPLARVLGGTRIAGLRAHYGEVVAKGVWPAIITEAEHRRVRAALAARTTTGSRGREPWLL